MTDEEMIQDLQCSVGRFSPAELAGLLVKLGPGRPTQFDVIRFFVMAFEGLSVAMMMEASGHLFNSAGADEASFNAMLGPHLVR